MPTLLLRLQGPMQSWGTTSRLDRRDTGLEPSKSGVIGLLCAALGRHRSEPVDDLAAMRMGVRVDREGVVRYDYQTAKGVIRADGTLGRDSRKDTVQSWRFYLADAVFLVGLESSDRSLLERLHEALQNPRWPLFLGRKSYLPSPPVWLPNGLVDEPLEEAIARYPPLVERAPERYRYALEEPPRATPRVLANRVRRTDQPKGHFAQRRFVERHVWIIEAAQGEVPRVPV
ncbi:MAG: type I-E CRISPR-associated protein Cas5/CasD [Chloroflexi bacterium]|nr:type I-E CRISPR-associated protein Cas5/CasD [Chloroflexota bacterium]